MHVKNHVHNSPSLHYRKANGVADKFAHFALSSHGGSVLYEWMGAPPGWLLDTLVQDSLLTVFQF